MNTEIKPNDQLFVVMSVDGEDVEAVPHIRFITANKELAKRKLQEFRKKVNLRNEEYERCRECPYADCIDWDKLPIHLQRGACVDKDYHCDIPVFTQDREFIEKYLRPSD